MAETLTTRGDGEPQTRTTSEAEPQIRTIGTADLTDSLRKGLDDFKLMPTYLVLLTLIYPAVGLIAARAAQGNDVVPLIFPLISGFALVGPLAAVGLYELSRRREAGLDTRWTHVFDVLKTKSISTIIGLGVILAVLFAAWLGSAVAIQQWAMGSQSAGDIPTFLHDVVATPGGHMLIVVGNLVGFLFAVVTLAIAAFSFPLALDHDVSLPTAISTSVRALMANPGPMALWGLIVVGGLVLGAIPLFVGLAVVMPILGHATWHLYRRVVV